MFSIRTVCTKIDIASVYEYASLMSASSAVSPRGPSLREARKEFTRTQLCAAANDVFIRRGYAAATMDEIAKVAGSPRSTLYAYFSDKEHLLAAIADDYIVRVCEVVEKLPGPVPTLVEIRTWLDHFAEMVSEQRGPTELIRALGQLDVTVQPCQAFGQRFLDSLASRIATFGKAIRPGESVLFVWAQMMLWQIGDALCYRADHGDTQEARDRLFVVAALFHRFVREDL